ncbi:aminodeoxychorismate lyase [Tahibacter amnicola]|uniref:Aminodeoxychorismate lyase n=1 Tax=Tahibacter amnicola TaxID=2976241 RepID=A0ABY6BKT4_9GAMM|nr:aminodeoxychorismate lyase [Tahibacter amnicola]UXI69650.1 aminodeoxychorismate lyase [Tahibacter amnicola]
MTLHVRVDGASGERIHPMDRGLLYGDGLFETVLFRDGTAPLWQRHMARLASGCVRLGLPLPDAQALRSRCEEAAGTWPCAALRITWTRGPGERGYAAPASPQPTCVIAAGAAPVVASAAVECGVKVHLCQTRLARQPLLAGMKHLNRLEQVLARAEWQAADIAEGLVCDVDGNLISATAANIFVALGGTLVTPAVDHCGVAGVVREELLSALPVTVRPLTLEDLMHAEELFLTSSIRGALPVAECDGRRHVPGTFVRRAQAHLQRIGVMVAV